MATRTPARPTSAFALAALAVLVLSGCAASHPAAGPAQPPAQTQTQTPTRDVSGAESDPEGRTAAPAAFVDRRELPSCGTVELRLGESIPQDAIDCVTNAPPEGAELLVTAPTDEGDPIAMYYRALPGGGIEVFADMTQDAFGIGWSHAMCPQATSVVDLGECTEERLD